MARWLKYLSITAILVSLVWWFNYQPPLTVDVITPEFGIVETTVANTRAGTVTACQRARMSLPVGGQIEKIFVKEGDLVKQDTILLSLWNADKQALLNEVKSRVKIAELNQQQACIVSRTEQREAKRLAELVNKGLTSEENAEAAQSHADSTAASCLAAKAEVISAKARVNTIEAQLEQTYLKAPFDGTIAEVTGEIGEYTTPSPPGVATPPAVDMLTEHCHYIQAPIDEVDAAQLAVGTKVRITLDAYRNQSFEGTLKRVYPYVQDYEKQARTVTVEVTISDPNIPTLLAGYSADIEIILAIKTNVLRLPTDVVINSEYVYVLTNEGTVEKRAVQLGLSNWHYVEVIDGVSKSDNIISSIANKQLKTGIKALPSKPQPDGQ